MQVAHKNRFLILASSVPAATATDAGLLPSIPNVPLHQLVTFHVVGGYFTTVAVNLLPRALCGSLTFRALLHRWS